MLYIKELPGAGGRLIYSGRRESIRTKGEFFMRKYIVKKTAFVSHDFILRILHHLHSDEMSSRLLCGNESDAAFAGSGCKVL
mgnify:CR=1 FL=1